MTSAVAAVGSIAAGAVLALVALFGGVSAMTSASTTPQQSEQVVFYDAQ